MRMDVRQREVAKRESNLAAEPRLDALHLPQRLAGVRALIVAVLEDHPPVRITPDVVHLRLERCQHRAK